MNMQTGTIHNWPYKGGYLQNSKTLPWLRQARAAYLFATTKAQDWTQTEVDYMDWLESEE